MNPEIWGSHGWKFLHAVTLVYPNKPSNREKKEYKEFFTTIGNVLPCYGCREHYQKNLKKFPLTDDILSSQKTLVKWLIDLHNDVNKRLGKKVFTGEVESIFNETQTNSVTSLLVGIIAFLLIIIGVLIILSAN